MLNWAVKLKRNSPVLFGVGLAVGALVGAAMASRLLDKPTIPALSGWEREDRKRFRREQTRAELNQLRNKVRNDG